MAFGPQGIALIGDPAASGSGSGTSFSGGTVANAIWAQDSAVTAGSATAPSYSFAEDRDTGMYRINSNILGFASSGTGRWRINNDGTFRPEAADNTLDIGSIGQAPRTVRASTSVQGPSGTAILPALTFSSEASLGFYRSAASTIALSYGMFSLKQNRLLSLRTLAASALTESAALSNITVDEVVLTIGGASGASLAVYSGGTVYIFNSALSAKAT